MNNVVCNYAPIRFLPYREVGEFINVGVVVHCPQYDFFGFKLVSTKRTARVKGFFPELDVNIFKAALQGIRRELNRIQAEHIFLENSNGLPMEVIQAQMGWFNGLIRKREGLLHFGEPGSLLAKSGEAGLDQLFKRYVERHFAQANEYHETEMRRRLDHMLHEWNIARCYERNRQIGDDDFHVVIPFVHSVNQKPCKAVKPLDLTKRDPSDIYQHGGTWVKNMERLKTRGHFPPQVVFAVELPEDGKRLVAAKTICQELAQLDVLPVNIQDSGKLHEALIVRAHCVPNDSRN